MERAKTKKKGGGRRGNTKILKPDKKGRDRIPLELVLLANQETYNIEYINFSFFLKINKKKKNNEE